MQAERSISRRNILFGVRRTKVRPELVVADQCLSRSGVTCRVCEDLCVARALRFRPLQGGASHLIIDTDTCTRCGECLPVCPVDALSLKETPDYG